MKRVFQYLVLGFLCSPLNSCVVPMESTTSLPIEGFLQTSPKLNQIAECVLGQPVLVEERDNGGSYARIRVQKVLLFPFFDPVPFGKVRNLDQERRSHSKRELIYKTKNRNVITLELRETEQSVEYRGKNVETHNKLDQVTSLPTVERDFVYDLMKSKTIEFERYRIEIIEADKEKLIYKIEGQ